MTRRAIRGSAIRFRGDPFLEPGDGALVLHEDALITIEDGRILAVEDAAPALRDVPPDVEVTHYPGAILSPGFIDAHVHYPQMQMIGAAGEQLLEWLDRYTYVAERDFADAGHARDVAAALPARAAARRNDDGGGLLHRPSPVRGSLLRELDRFDTRMIAGKVLMDRNAPEALRDTAEAGYREFKRLIEAWHGKGRHSTRSRPASRRPAATSSSPPLRCSGASIREPMSRRT